MILQTQSKFQQNQDAYRQLPHLNYSAIKDFDENRSKFYRRYVLQEYTEDDASSSTVFGDLVHCLLLTPEVVDERFSMMTHIDMPKPQMKALIDSLWEITKKNLSEGGEITRPIKDMLEEAFQTVAYNKSGERIMFKGKDLAYVVSKFESEGRLYYSMLRENFGKPVISSRTRENAEKLVAELHANPVTRDILSIRTNSRYSVHTEVPIVFEYNGHILKSKIDLLIVDHEKKVIDFYDLKSTGWDLSSFEGNILRNRYYLQWAMYYLAVKHYAVSLGYTVHPMQFIVVSTDTNENPLIYTTSMKDVNHGLSGFTMRSGKKYKGLNQLLTEISWHYTYGIWNMSYTDYQNNGIKKVSLFDEIV